jgi:hypothetical protein
MSASTDVRSLTIDLAKRTAALKAELKALLKSLPPNPDAHMIAPNCCVVSSKALRDCCETRQGNKCSNWSPTFWINSEMITRISELIDKARPENLRKTIIHILRSGSYAALYGQTMRIHPAALKALRRAWLGGTKTTKFIVIR